MQVDQQNYQFAVGMQGEQVAGHESLDEMDQVFVQEVVVDRIAMVVDTQEDQRVVVEVAVELVKTE